MEVSAGVHVLMFKRTKNDGALWIYQDIPNRIVDLGWAPLLYSRLQ